MDDAPEIDVSPLFGPPSPEREGVDVRVLQAMTVTGMMTITGLPCDVRLDVALRRGILGLFGGLAVAMEAFTRNTRDPLRPLSRRGGCPTPQPGRLSWYDAFQIGADVGTRRCSHR